MTDHKIDTPNEDAMRPGYGAVASRLAKALEELDTARQAEAEAQATVTEHEALADSKPSKPKNWAHDLSEFEGTLRWATKRRANKQQEADEAQRQMDAAEHALALARMRDRAEVIRKFDPDEFVARYQAKLAPLVAELWGEVHLLQDLETEITEIANAAGIDSSEPRYRPSSGSDGGHLFDGIELRPIGLTTSTVSEALEVGEDPREVREREERLAAWSAKRDAEERERKEEQALREAAEEHYRRNGKPRPFAYGDNVPPMKTTVFNGRRARD